MNKTFQLLLLIGLLAGLLKTSPLQAQQACKDSSFIVPNGACIAIYDPVCGCDGFTYGNSCEALTLYGTTSWIAGTCPVSDCAGLDISYESYLITNSTQVTFLDQSSMANGQILTWSWDFGDGNSSSEQNPVHTYSAPGTYPVCLTVVALGPNGQNCEGTACQMVEVPENCFDQCMYDFEYDLSGTTLHAAFDFGDIDPPFFFYVDWSLDGGAATGTGLDFVKLIETPGIHTLCATYPTGDFTPETCTVCQAIEVTTNCIEPSQIDSSANCGAVFDPVCGCDGVTYSNRCEAQYYGGVTSWLPGTCGSICNNLFIDFIGENTGGSLTVWTFQPETVFPGGNLTSWFWDFGNGQTSMEEAPTLNFQDPGEYEVCLTVSGLFADGTQCGGTFCKKIIVAGQACFDPSVIDQNVLCPAVYEPVCGCNGVTYPNECVAYNYNGITAWTPGICATDCINPAWVDSSAACLKIYDPVCGCDNVTYDNDCYAIRYGGVTSWTQGPCCPNPECKADFEVELLLAGNSILVINRSLNAEASLLDFGDGSPMLNGVFDSVYHTYPQPGTYQICLEISNFAGTCTNKYCYLVNLTSNTSDPNAPLVQMDLAPNPAQNQTTVRVSGANPQQIQLLDMFGKIVRSEQINQALYELETASIPAGVYLLQVWTDRGMVARKLVITR
jgi:PKD repeat protein